jgi:hypothetical protein
MKITPLHPALAPRVSGVDLSQLVEAGAREALAAPSPSNSRWSSPRSRWTPSMYLRAAFHLRPADGAALLAAQHAGRPVIGLIWHRNGQQPAEAWHTDHTNRERSAGGRPSSTAWRFPRPGGATSVASMRAAYTALRGRRGGRLDGLRPSTASTVTPTPGRGSRQVTAASSSTDGPDATRSTAHARYYFHVLQDRPRARH